MWRLLKDASQARGAERQQLWRVASRRGLSRHTFGRRNRYCVKAARVSHDCRVIDAETIFEEGLVYVLRPIRTDNFTHTEPVTVS